MTEEITWKQFKDAIEAGDLDKVKDCVENDKFDLNAADSEGVTPIYFATKQVRINSPCEDASLRESLMSIVGFLAESGAEVDVLVGGGTYGGGWTSLGEALRENEECVDLVKLLVENGADVNNPTCGDGGPALMIAVRNRYLSLVEYLIEKGADVNGKHSESGKSVLADACSQSCNYGGDGGGESGEEELGIVRCLLENGADPNVESDDKSSLREACYSGTGRLENRLDIIKLLVETGAYDELIETPYNRVYTPVFNTCGFGKWALDCFQYFTEKFPNLLKNEEYRNLYLIHAAAEKQFALMEALLDAGADINAVDKHGKSPLLAFALSYGAPIGHPFPKESASIDCMRYLIEKGADIFQREEVNGQNLLHAFLRSMPSETERRIEDGYDTPDKSLEFFKELLEKGIPWEEECRGGGKVKDMLIERTMVEWLDCLKEFEGGDGSETPEKVNFGEPSECRIYYGGIHVLREYINIVLKDGEEIDGSRTAWEKGSFHFTWMLPRSLNILFDALAKGADWVHYFEDSYRQKWQSEKPDIDYDECECQGGNGMSPGDYFFDSNDDYIDRESIAEFDDGWTGDTESIYFEASHRGNLTLRDEQGNWIRFDPMPNDYWKISQGTSEDSEKQPLHVDLVSGDEFDLIERVKEVCGTPALERKIFLHRNGQTYGPYSRSSVERFLLENLASPNDWARFKESGEWTRLKDLLEE